MATCTEVPHAGHADLLTATPCHGPDVAVADALLADEFERRRVELLDGERDAEAELPRRLVKPPRVLRQFEDVAVVDPFALEDSTAVVQTVGEDVQTGVAPGDELPVEPDHAVAVVEGGEGHCAAPVGA